MIFWTVDDEKILVTRFAIKFFIKVMLNVQKIHIKVCKT